MLTIFKYNYKIDEGLPAPAAMEKNTQSSHFLLILSLSFHIWLDVPVSHMGDVSVDSRHWPGSHHRSLAPLCNDQLEGKFPQDGSERDSSAWLCSSPEVW